MISNGPWFLSQAHRRRPTAAYDAVAARTHFLLWLAAHADRAHHDR